MKKGAKGKKPPSVFRIPPTLEDLCLSHILDLLVTYPDLQAQLLSQAQKSYRENASLLGGKYFSVLPNILRIINYQDEYLPER